MQRKHLASTRETENELQELKVQAYDVGDMAVYSTTVVQALTDIKMV